MNNPDLAFTLKPIPDELTIQNYQDWLFRMSKVYFLDGDGRIFRPEPHDRLWTPRVFQMATGESRVYCRHHSMRVVGQS